MPPCQPLGSSGGVARLQSIASGAVSGWCGRRRADGAPRSGRSHTRAAHRRWRVRRSSRQADRRRCGTRILSGASPVPARLVHDGHRAGDGRYRRRVRIGRDGPMRIRSLCCVIEISSIRLVISPTTLVVGSSDPPTEKLLCGTESITFSGLTPPGPAGRSDAPHEPSPNHRAEAQAASQRAGRARIASLAVREGGRELRRLRLLGP